MKKYDFVHELHGLFLVAVMLRARLMLGNVRGRNNWSFGCEAPPTMQTGVSTYP